MHESNKPHISARSSGRIVPFPAFHNTSDSELIRATLDGDDAAFEALMKRYMPLVAGYLHGAMPSPNDTEDLIQEVFFSAYRHLGRLKQPDRIGPWLIRIARNKRSDFFRGRDRQIPVGNLVHHAASLKDDPLDQVPDAGADTASQASARELSAIVSEAISRLSDKYRLILNLRLLEEMTTSEIARQLYLNESTVRTRLVRGLAKLRRDLKRQGI